MSYFNPQEYETCQEKKKKKIMKFEASEDTISKKCFSQDEMKLVGKLEC
jgi:hypothetical protein